MYTCALKYTKAALAGAVQRAGHRLPPHVDAVGSISFRLVLAVEFLGLRLSDFRIKNLEP